MKLFKILMLVTAPIVLVQFYSADSHALLSEQKQIDALFEQAVLSKSKEPEMDLESGLKHEDGDPSVETDEIAMIQNESLLADDEAIDEPEAIDNHAVDTQESSSSESRFSENKLSETKLPENKLERSPEKTKKVRLVQGKNNSQGMDLLTVLLMLKDRQR